MMPIIYPQITQVEVVATQPQPADLRVLEHLRASQMQDLNHITYIVKINLMSPLPATSAGFVLSVGDYRISRYASFPGGIYFKVHDPQFFEDHGGEVIQFSVAGMAPQSTGYRLPATADNLTTTDELTRSVRPSGEEAVNLEVLPTQEEVLRTARQ